MNKKVVEVENLDVKAELEALRAELRSLREEKRQFSKDIEDAVESARENMLTDDEEMGALYIDEKHKEEGFHYRIVDTTRPGRVQKLTKLGYEVVYNNSMEIGDNTVAKSGKLSDMVTVELGISHGSATGVLMRCPKEHYDKRQKAKVKRNQEYSNATVQDAVNKSHFGTISIGDEVFKR